MTARTDARIPVASDAIISRIAPWAIAALVALSVAYAPALAEDIYGGPVYPARLSATDPAKNAVGVGSPLYNGMEYCELFDINNAEKIRRGSISGSTRTSPRRRACSSCAYGGKPTTSAPFPGRSWTGPR